MTTLRPGFALPPRLQVIDAATMAAYAGATWDWFSIHLDAEAARRAGFLDAIVDGQMLGAILAAHAQDGAGPGVRVTAMTFRNTSAVYRGEMIRVTGSCTQVASGRATIEQDVHVIDPVTQRRVRAAVQGALTTIETAPAVTAPRGEP